MAVDEHKSAEAWAELLLPRLHEAITQGQARDLPLPVLVGVIYEIGAQLAREIGYTPGQIVELLEAQIATIEDEDEDEDEPF